MKKHIIDTYNTIYYVDIVVANEAVTLEELKELFIFSNGEELDESILNVDCCTCKCIRKEDNKDVCLIKYNNTCKIKNINKKLDFINTICHESGHAALDIYQHMNQDLCFCSPEPFCYLLGYVSECIYKTLTKK